MTCALTAASACAGPAPSRPAATAAASTAVPAVSPRARPNTRVAVIVMENKDYSDIVGNPSAPFVNHLAPTSAVATSYFAVAHPSLPNYLAMIGGETFGIDTDCTRCHVAARNLVDQLEDAHITWKAYMEGMPRACFPGSSSGRYAKKHDPFVYFDDVAAASRRCGNVVPLSSLDYGALPQFVWITPDLCHDTHDCSVRTGDGFLSELLPPLIRALGPRGVLILTYDEGSGGAHGGGHVFTLATGPGARPGRYSQPFDHYSLLRTIEDRLGLPHLGAAARAAPMTAMLR
jgi:hypothetical protein